MTSSSRALAAPTFGTPTLPAESHTGIIGACDPSWCTFDAGTNLVECDMASFCGANNGALGIITDRIVNTVSYEWLATVECANLTTSSCTIDDPGGEVDGFRMRGTDLGEYLLWSYCPTGFSACPYNCSCLNSPIIGVSPSHGTTITVEANGAGGDDQMVGSNTTSSIDTLRGNGGTDGIAGLDGIDWIYGGANPSGARNRDTLYGGAGEDHIYGESGDDELYGGDGDDHLDGGDGDDRKLEGAGGNDTILGGSGLDILTGYEGNDLLIGGDGDDTLEGGIDNDILCEDGTDGDLMKGDGNVMGWTGDDMLWYDPAGGVAPDPLSSGHLGFDICTSVFVPLAPFECESSLVTKPNECP